MLIIQLKKKTDYDTKVTKIEHKLNNQNHNQYTDTQEFNKLAADVFNARLAQADLETNFFLITLYQALILKLREINHQVQYFKEHLKGQKSLTQIILKVKIILKKMAHKI